MEPLKIPLNLLGVDCESSGSVGMSHLLPFFERRIWMYLLSFFESEGVFFAWKSSEIKFWRAVRACDISRNDRPVVTRMHLEFFWNFCMNCCIVCFHWKCSWSISHDPCSDPWIGFPCSRIIWSENSIRISGRLCRLIWYGEISVFCHFFVWCCCLSRIARAKLYSWWLCSKNYWFFSDLTYLKCWKYLFEIVLLLPWAEILGMGNLE